MSDALYERYKDALQRGHVAAQRGRDAVALEAYSEAARLAPDRALPLVGLAGVLRRLGKTAEAITTFDAALDRAPADETALRARAELASDAGDRVGAADHWDRLAVALDAKDRLPEAADAARHALEAAESRARRTTLRRYADRLAAAGDAEATLAALDRARLALEERVDADAPPELPPEPPIDPVAALDDLAAAVDAGDAATATDLAQRIAARQRGQDHGTAAIDACYLALAVAPADPGLHLTLADIYLDRGWRVLAIDKLDRLAQLASLSDDGATRDRVCAIVAERLPDEARLTARCG
jgi:tetratricopeptide (TPR) repeat protein